MCTMYGTCSGDPLDRRVDCAANVPAKKPLVPQMAPQFCPQWAHRQWNESCCDQGQARALENMVSQAEAILSRCPACYANFLFFMCEVRCSPNQSLFLEVTSSTPSPTGHQVVNSTLVSIATDWATAFFESCAEVKMPGTASNSTVMEVIFGADSPQEFLAFLGEQGVTVEQSPIQIDFNYTTLDDQQSINDIDYLYACDTKDPNFQCRASDCDPTAHPDVVAVELGVTDTRRSSR